MLWGEIGAGYDAQRSANSDQEVRQEGRLDLRAGFEPTHGITFFAGGSLARRIVGFGADFRGEYALGAAFL
jgi:hypothetical protein